MTAKRFLLVSLTWVAIIILAAFVSRSVKADGGGFPTATRTVTPTSTPPTQAPTATFTILPTLTPAIILNQGQVQEEVIPTPIPVAAETTGGFTLGCWPIGILIVLALIILGTYYISRRLRGQTEES